MDVYVMLLFGAIAYFMQKLDFPSVPIVLLKKGDAKQRKASILQTEFMAKSITTEMISVGIMHIRQESVRLFHRMLMS